MCLCLARKSPDAEAFDTVETWAHMRAKDTVDYTRVQIASIVCQLEAMPAEERARLAEHCRGIVREHGNPLPGLPPEGG
jgi:hypothetical protein